MSKYKFQVGQRVIYGNGAPITATISDRMESTRRLPIENKYNIKPILAFLPRSFWAKESELTAIEESK